MPDPRTHGKLWLATLVAALVIVHPLCAAGPTPGHPSWQMDTGG